MSSNNATRQDVVADDWYVDAFGALYPIVYAHRTSEAAAPEARFAAEAVRLTQDDVVLDLCCGAGRHLVRLQQLTRRLAGVDYSPALLTRAHKALSDTVGLARADMRALPFFEAFDVVFSFFTSFGYFMDDAENYLSVLNMAQALKPGGRFFLDYLNPNAVAQQLQAATTRESQGCVIHEQRWIDADARRVNKRVTVTRDNQRLGVTMESVRLYTHDEMAAMLTRAGLRVTHTYGDYDGAAYASDSPRMLLTGLRGAS